MSKQRYASYKVAEDFIPQKHGMYIMNDMIPVESAACTVLVMLIVACWLEMLLMLYVLIMRTVSQFSLHPKLRGGWAGGIKVFAIRAAG